MDANETADPQVAEGSASEWVKLADLLPQAAEESASEWAKLAALLPPDVAAACEKNAADFFTAGSVAYSDEAIAQGFAWIEAQPIRAPWLP